MVAQRVLGVYDGSIVVVLGIFFKKVEACSRILRIIK